MPSARPVSSAPRDLPLGSGPYHELAAPAGLVERVTCLWVRPATDAGTVLVIPDGCVDVIWRTDGHLLIAGPDLGPVEHEQPAVAAYVGVRLRPGTAGATLGVDVSDLVEQLIDAPDLLGADGHRLVDRLEAAPDLAAQLDALAIAVAERADRRRLDTDVAAVATGLASGVTPIARAVRATGLSERHLRRRFQAQVGYGPKTFARIMRLQRFVDVARRRSSGLATVAAEIGYADQAHLTRECRALTGRTPTELLQTIS